MIDTLTRLTPFVIASPERYVVRNDTLASVDLKQFSKEFEWTQDSWWGIRDVASRPTKTLDLQTGDCEDYALLVASVLASRGVSGVELVYGVSWRPFWGHTVAYDPNAERVYSSGNIRETDIESYADEEFDRYVRRPVA